MMAEITLSHLLQLANEHGCPLAGNKRWHFSINKDRVRDEEANDAGWRGFYCTQVIGAVH